jgi:osmotically-inducible protein OsmY
MTPKIVNSIDQELRERVERQLDYDPAVPSINIGVSASAGVVTLSGYVGTYADKLAAEKAAKSVYEVKAIANDIEVKPPAERVDPDLAADAVAALDRNVNVPRDLVQVTVKKCWLTIDGKLDWAYQKDAAEQTIRSLYGVRGVTNNIVINPDPIADDVRAKIEDSIRRNAELDARRIRVMVNGKSITLSGSVQSWREREAAEQAAWHAPGVTNVENRLEIIP